MDAMDVVQVNEQGQIAEHWGVVDTIGTWANWDCCHPRTKPRLPSGASTVRTRSSLAARRSPAIVLWQLDAREAAAGPTCQSAATASTSKDP
jgi:hypothetical protein